MHSIRRRFDVDLIREKNMKRLLLLATVFFGLHSNAAMTEENRIDVIRPDAPELAAFGPNAIGVRTLQVVHTDQADIANIEAGKPIPRADRKLNLEIWYPASVPAGTAGGEYKDVLLRDGETKVSLHGKAIRDAEPLKAGSGAWPLVIISHGYPGNRFLLSPLAENLASKGYVVASIDHANSTYDDKGKFGSTLVNRPLDQKFVLQEMDRLSSETDGFLAGLVDASNTAVIGYSMGGYGAVITAGAGVTLASTELEWGAPEKTLGVNRAGSPAHQKLIDERIKAIVAFAPWGMERGFWDEAGLAGITKPVFFVAGSLDDVSGYEKGTRKIYTDSINSDRYLLTFENANHNAGAPMPAPAEILGHVGHVGIFAVRSLRRPCLGQRAHEQCGRAFRHRLPRQGAQGRSLHECLSFAGRKIEGRRLGRRQGRHLEAGAHLLEGFSKPHGCRAHT